MASIIMKCDVLLLELLEKEREGIMFCHFFIISIEIIYCSTTQVCNL